MYLAGCCVSSPKKGRVPTRGGSTFEMNRHRDLKIFSPAICRSRATRLQQIPFTAKKKKTKTPHSHVGKKGTLKNSRGKVAVGNNASLRLNTGPSGIDKAEPLHLRKEEITAKWKRKIETNEGRRIRKRSQNVQKGTRQGRQPCDARPSS